MKGVIDRIEDEFATILIDEIGEQLTIPEHKLPPGCNEGTWLNIQDKHGVYVITSIDKVTTTEEANKTKKLMNKLHSRKKSSKFKRH